MTKVRVYLFSIYRLGLKFSRVLFIKKKSLIQFFLERVIFLFSSDLLEKGYKKNQQNHNSQIKKHI